MPSVVYAECHVKTLNAQCPYTECHYPECRYAECCGGGRIIN